MRDRSLTAGTGRATRRVGAAVVVGAMVAAFVLVSAPAVVAAAAPIVVTTTTPDAEGSIQQAFSSASSNPGPDTIVLQSSALYLLNCASAALGSHGGELSIVGNGATIRHQSCASRIIDHSSTSELTVSNLTTQQWDEPGNVAGCGGSVYAAGALVLNMVNVFGGRTQANGGGACSDASIKVNGGGVMGARADGDGGGLYAPTIEIDGAHLSHNHAQRGGGAWAATLVVHRGSAEQNSAQDGGGYWGQSVDLQNATIDWNWASRGGGAFLASGSIEHATFSRNGGGSMVVAGGTASIAANVLEHDGSSFALPNCLIVSGALISGGYNSSDDATCAPTGVGDVGAYHPSDLQAVAWADPAPTNPLGMTALDWEKFAEGKLRLRKPKRDSPVVNTIPSGHSLCLGRDQRGFARPIGAGCEPGAVESTNEGSVFVPTEPQRLLDTRTFMVPTGHVPGTKIQGSETVQTRVAGIGSIPSDATAVVINMTSTEATNSAGYLTVWPSGSARPLASSVNMQPGANVPNLLTVKVGTGGHINVFTNVGATHVVMDVFGYYRDQPDRGDGFQSFDPHQRILDTRTTNVPPGWPRRTPLQEGTTLQLPVAGPGTAVPSNASAVVMNITSTQAKSDLGYVTAWPNGGTPPATSNLNLQRKYNVANLATVKVGADGRVNLSTNIASTHLVVDLLGYYGPSTDATFLPLSPSRVLDTRSGQPLGPAGSSEVQIMDPEQILSNEIMVVANLTATQATSANGYATAGNGVADTSTLNYRPGYNVANAFIASLTQGRFWVGNSAGSVHLIVDVVGTFKP